MYKKISFGLLGKKAQKQKLIVIELFVLCARWGVKLLYSATWYNNFTTK